MPKLDLTKPGKLFAVAENENTYTFHLVLPDGKDTKDALSKSPNVRGRRLMPPVSIPRDQVDGEGRAIVDLSKSGRAKKIMAEIDKIYAQGKGPVDKVNGIVVVTARGWNAVPDKQLADVQEFDLAPVPRLDLKGERVFVTVKNFKGGQKEFTATLLVMGPMKEVQLTTSPAHAIKAKGQNGANIKCAVKDGEKVKITVAVPFRKKGESKNKRVKKRYRHYVPGGWRTKRWGDWTTAKATREVWTGGNITLRACGTGDKAGIVKSIKMRAESWASAWLVKNPPPVLRHNIC